MITLPESMFSLCATVLALLLGASASVADDAAESKAYQCDGENLEIEVFPPTDGVMEARAADLVVRISVSDARRFDGNGFSITLEIPSFSTTTIAKTAEQALDKACDLLADHVVRTTPNEAERSEQLSKLYEGLSPR